MCSNLAESWNKMIDETRHMPITSMIDSIRVQSMEDMAKKRAECKKWNGLICPVVHTRLQAALDKSSTWSIRTSNENLHEVQSEPSFVVDIALRTCSCGGWQHNGFPCSHTVAVLNNSSHITGKDLMDYIGLFSCVILQTICGNVHSPNYNVG